MSEDQSLAYADQPPGKLKWTAILEHCSGVSIITQGQKKRPYALSELKAISNGFHQMWKTFLLVKLRVTHTASTLGVEMSSLIAAITQVEKGPNSHEAHLTTYCSIVFFKSRTSKLISTRHLPRLRTDALPTHHSITQQAAPCFSLITSTQTP